MPGVEDSNIVVIGGLFPWSSLPDCIIERYILWPPVVEEGLPNLAGLVPSITAPDNDMPGSSGLFGSIHDGFGYRDFIINPK